MIHSLIIVPGTGCLCKISVCDDIRPPLPLCVMREQKSMTSIERQGSGQTSSAPSAACCSWPLRTTAPSLPKLRRAPLERRLEIFILDYAAEFLAHFGLGRVK